MAKLPDYVRTDLNDARGEIKRLKHVVDQLAAKKGPSSEESRLFNALIIISEQHQNSIEAIIEAIEGKK